MGDIAPYMTSSFIKNAFFQMGERPLEVKMMFNKFDGMPANYCFVEFSDVQTAKEVVLRLNGKMIPGSNPMRRFKLNHASYGRSHLLTPEFSVFVGDLHFTVDDYLLYQAFSSKYKSCKTAKVIFDGNGESRCYGFVRFSDEAEQKRALHEMNGHLLRGRRMLVHLADKEKNKKPQLTVGEKHRDYMNMPTDYQQSGYDYSTWNPQGYWKDTQDYTPNYQPKEETPPPKADDEYELQDPATDVDVEDLNATYMDLSEDLYMAMEESRWHPLESVMSKITSAAA